MLYYDIYFSLNYQFVAQMLRLVCFAQNSHSHESLKALASEQKTQAACDDGQSADEEFSQRDNGNTSG